MVAFRAIHDCLEILRGGSADEDSALNVGTNFFFELSEQPIWHQPISRNAFIQSVFQTLTTGRNPGRTLDKLKAHVKRRFEYLPFQEREIISLIDTWKQTQIT